MTDRNFLAEHGRLSRRYFLKAGAVGAAALGARRLIAAEEPMPTKREKPDKAGAWADPYFTPPEDFRDVSRGNPLPHSLSDDKRHEVGLTRETWKLEVVSDPDNPARLGNALTSEQGTALDFAGLLALGQTRAVRFAKVMTCLNVGCPLGMGLWEGVPLRDVVWMARPRDDLRRIFYYGYHNDDPAQMFRSSLPVGRVLEDPFDLPPVILCYKLNGQWLDAERGGPVRVVVPEAYGFKSIKWLTHVVLSNGWFANDTYGEKNNDVDSPLKSFAAVLSLPTNVKPDQPIAVSGYAQVGISGVSKVQVSIESADAPHPADDPYFTQAAWRDAEILSPPRLWSGLDGGKIPADVLGFTAQGEPKTWPMRLAKVHWAATWPGLPEGRYMLRSRTIDDNGQAQPMPRPFRKSGHAQIETITFKVQA